MTVIRFYIIVQLLLLLNYSSASYVALPNINFDPLQQLGITGNLGGISIYKDTNQLTQIPAYTSSILSYTNDTFQLIGSTETNQTIYTICSIGTTTFIGGNFTTLNGVVVNNIAKFVTTSNSTSTIQPLQMGLDGPVYTMYCDSDTVYVGGAFLAPVASDNVQYTESLAQFGGGMAMYKNNQWQGLPWKGVNGPVNSIVKEDHLLLFGGSFDTTTDLQTSRAPASQPITLISAVAAVNSSTTYSDPSTVLCASTNNTTPWTLADGETGTWQATFDYFITPTLIRLVNSNLDNYKTKGFAIRPLTASTTNPYFNLSFVDPVTGQRTACSNNCTLTNTNVYQDFIVTDTDVSAGGIAIDILSWYGNGGGLSSVEMYQSEIFVYAVDTMVNQTCKAVSTVSTTGTWSRVNGSVSYEAYLSTTLTTSNNSKTALTFTPSLAESGFYQVLLYSPACTDCLDIDVTIQNGGGTTNVVTVSQASTVASSQAIFTGYFDINTTQPTIKIGIAHNATVSSTKDTIMVNSIQFIQQATADNLTSILQYDTSVTNITSVPWGPLTGDNLPYDSKDVYTMTILNKQIYIGGKFTSTDSTGSNYTNIVTYDTTTNKFKALSQTGPNGPVYTMTATNTGDLFVGGNFSSLTTVTNQLSNVARYNINQQTWNSLNGGVDGTVYGVFQIDDTTILISGDFQQLSIGNATSQNGWWDTATNQWSTTTPYISGIVYDFANSFYTGSINSAQQYQTNGFITVNNNSSLINNNNFYPSNSDASISTGILYNVGQTSTMVLAGKFSLSNQIQNLAIYSNQTWSSFNDVVIQGTIMSMLIYQDLLYVGGQFTSDGLNNLAVFDLNNKSLSANPSVQIATDNSAASVNIIRQISSQNSIVIGGNFTQVGTFSCNSICSLNLATLQWNALGTGLTGQIYDINEIDGDLVVTGDLTLNNSPLRIAQYDYNKNTWGPFSTADLPGPSQYMMYDSVKKSLYITGQVNETTYLRIWDGQQFNSPSTDLGVGSSINQLSLLPLTDNEDSILLASGFLNLGDKNVSAAFYDGSNWIPYLVTSSSAHQSDNTLSGLFYLSQPQIVTVINHYLSTGIVILISIAISLGIVFLIVFCAMGCLFIKRKRDAKVNPETNPSAYYGKPPQDPHQLLFTLQKADPGLENDDNAIEYEKKRRDTLEPGDQLYNMSKSISTEHLHDPPISQSNFNMGAAALGGGAAAAVIGNGFSKSHEMIPTQQQFRSMPNNNNNNYNATPNNNDYNAMSNNNNYKAVPNNNYNAITTNTAFGTTRPESFARPVSEINRDSFTNSINYETSPMPTSREMTELNNRGSYNPFRSSTAGIGMAIGAGAGAVTAMNHNNSNNNSNNNNNSGGTYDFLSTPPTAQQVSYGNIPPSQPEQISSSNNPDTVRWTQAPPEVTSVAVVKPVSMLKDDKQQQNVLWTTANSDNAKSQAIIAPVISLDHHQEDDMSSTPTNHHNLQNLPNSASTLTVAQPENVRWTNFSTSGAMGTLTVEPGRESTYSDFYSAYDVTHDIPLPLAAAAAAAAPVHQEQQQQQQQKSNEEEEKKSSFSTDPDIVRWTTAPTSNLAVAQIEHLDRESYQPPLTNKNNKLYDESESSIINAKVMHPNAFRLSDAGSLISKPSNGNFKSDNRVSRYDIGDSDNEESSAREVRWKMANVASPIETGEPPKLMEPASVMITSRGQTPNDDDDDTATSPFDSYFNNIMFLNKNKNETVKKQQQQQQQDKENKKKKKKGENNHQIEEQQQSNFLSENYNEKSKSIDDLIASRDLAGLSYILNEAEEHPQPKLTTHEQEAEQHLVTPQSSTSTPMDGRASSKRMVQEYLLNKKGDRPDKKAKYKSSFKQLMTTAIENNQKSKFATEDAPHLYYAKFDFSASEQDELGFVNGDAIIVIDSSDDIWWTGYKTNGDDGFIRGVFPSNYVEMATSLNI